MEHSDWLNPERSEFCNTDRKMAEILAKLGPPLQIKSSVWNVPSFQMKIILTRANQLEYNYTI